MSYGTWYPGPQEKKRGATLIPTKDGVRRDGRVLLLAAENQSSPAPAAMVRGAAAGLSGGREDSSVRTLRSMT